MRRSRNTWRSIRARRLAKRSPPAPQCTAVDPLAAPSSASSAAREQKQAGIESSRAGELLLSCHTPFEKRPEDCETTVPRDCTDSVRPGRNCNHQVKARRQAVPFWPFWVLLQTLWETADKGRFDAVFGLDRYVITLRMSDDG